MEERRAFAAPSPPLPPEVVEEVGLGGDLSELNAGQRAEYYAAVCRSLGLNPLTKPFEYLTLHGQLRLYALRDCAEQLRRLHGISIYIANRERMDDIYVVTARAKDRQGREDESTGAVPLGDLRGDALANALMRAETKAKRRVTLSIAGLGWLDETELETMPQGPHAVIPPEASQASEEPPAEVHPTADQVSALVEMARSCGVDLTSFGNHLRRLMQLAAETTITKKFLRESMTMAQYEGAWQHYHEVRKHRVEAEVSDAPAAGDGGSPGASEDLAGPAAAGQLTDASGAASTADAFADATYASPQQIAALKRLAQQVGDEAYADVQDMLDHHPEGLVLGVYATVTQRLRARTAAKKADAPVHPQG
jgi:hypothetical protein